MPAHQHTTTLNTTPPALSRSGTQCGRRRQQLQLQLPMRTTATTAAAAAALLSRFDVTRGFLPSTLLKYTHLHPSSRVDVTRGFSTPTTSPPCRNAPTVTSTTQSGCV